MCRHILYDADTGVARITINRPKVLNAFTDQTLDELTEAFRAAGSNSQVGVVVLTGAGDRAFCAGGDVNWEAAGGLDKHAGAKAMMSLYTAVRESLKPCIARVNGYAIGGGHHLAYFCDFTIAADSAIFGQNGPRVGSPAQGWLVSYLVRVVGAKRAREMWMLCRRYTAQQALSWGLANAVVPMAELDAEVQRWCNEILSMSPSCIKALKMSFDDEYADLRSRQGDRDFVGEINPGFWESGEQAEERLHFLQSGVPIPRSGGDLLACPGFVDSVRFGTTRCAFCASHLGGNRGFGSPWLEPPARALIVGSGRGIGRTIADGLPTATIILLSPPKNRHRQVQSAQCNRPLTLGPVPPARRLVVKRWSWCSVNANCTAMDVVCDSQRTAARAR